MLPSLFVYGSLKRGFKHHDQLQGLACAGRVRTATGYRLVVYHGYPALTRGGTNHVLGELYQVSPQCLRALDAFEECPELYQRNVIDLVDGNPALAYTVEPEVADRYPALGDTEWRER